MTQVEIRLPELSGGTEAEQLQKIRSYLYTLAQQLQYAFDGVTQAQAAGSPAGTAGGGKTGASTPDFGAIKSLILKSAQITEHFSEAVEKRLAGKYVAQSQFGTFVRQTEQKITAGDQAIRQDFSNVQQMETEIAGLRSALMEVNASIRTGLLVENEQSEPIYGVEIGQQIRKDGAVRFQKFTRLTADRLAFYDANDVEVAYISDRQLHVTSADVAAIRVQSLSVEGMQMGDYIWQLGADGHLSIR